MLYAALTIPVIIGQQVCGICLKIWRENERSVASVKGLNQWRATTRHAFCLLVEQSGSEDGDLVVNEVDFPADAPASNR